MSDKKKVLRGSDHPLHRQNNDWVQLINLIITRIRRLDIHPCMFLYLILINMGPWDPRNKWALLSAILCTVVMYRWPPGVHPAVDYPAGSIPYQQVTPESQAFYSQGYMSPPASVKRRTFTSTGTLSPSKRKRSGEFPTRDLLVVGAVSVRRIRY